MKSAFLAAPSYNEPQTFGTEKMEGILSAAGFTVVKEGTPVASTDLVVVWLDGLMPPGVAIHAVSNPTQQAQVPVDDETRKILQAGMMATGKGLPGMTTKGGLLLPGKQQDLKNLSIGLQLQGNAAIVQIASPPLNIPDPTVLVNLGIAFALNIPVIGMAVGQVMAGPYVEKFPVVTGFEMLEEKVKILTEAESIPAAVAAMLAEAAGQSEEEEEISGEKSEVPPK